MDRPPDMLDSGLAHGDLILPFVHGRVGVKPDGEETCVAAVIAHHGSESDFAKGGRIRSVLWEFIVASCVPLPRLLVCIVPAVCRGRPVDEVDDVTSGVVVAVEDEPIAAPAASWDTFVTTHPVYPLEDADGAELLTQMVLLP